MLRKKYFLPHSHIDNIGNSHRRQKSGGLLSELGTKEIYCVLLLCELCVYCGSFLFLRNISH